MQTKEQYLKHKTLQEVVIRGLDYVYNAAVAEPKKLEQLRSKNIVTLLRKSFLALQDDKLKGDLFEVFVMFLQYHCKFWNLWFRGAKVIEVQQSTLTQDIEERWDIRLTVQYDDGKKRYKWVNLKNSEIINEERTKGFQKLPNKLRQIDGDPVDPQKDMIILYPGKEDGWRTDTRWVKGHLGTWESLVPAGIVSIFIDWLIEQQAKVNELKKQIWDSILKEYQERIANRRLPQTEFYNFLTTNRDILIRRVIAGQGVGKTLMQAEEQIITLNKNPNASIDYIQITIDLLQQNSFEIIKFVCLLHPNVKINMICSDLEYEITTQLGIPVNHISASKYLKDPNDITFNGELSDAKDKIIEATSNGAVNFCTQAQCKQFAQFRADNNYGPTLIQIDETVHKIKKQEARFDNDEDANNFQEALDLYINSGLRNEQTAYDANDYRGPSQDGFHFANEHYFGKLVIDWPWHKCHDHGLVMMPTPQYLIVPDTSKMIGLKKYIDKYDLDEDDTLSIHAIIYAIEQKIMSDCDHVWDIVLLRRSDSVTTGARIIKNYFKDKFDIDFIVQPYSHKERSDRNEWRDQRKDLTNKFILVLGVYIPAKGFDWPQAEELYIGRNYCEEFFTHVITRITRLFPGKILSRLNIVQHPDKENDATLMMSIAETFYTMGIDLKQILVDKNSGGEHGEEPGHDERTDPNKVYEDLIKAMKIVEVKFNKKLIKTVVAQDDPIKTAEVIWETLTSTR